MTKQLSQILAVAGLTLAMGAAVPVVASEEGANVAQQAKVEAQGEADAGEVTQVERVAQAVTLAQIGRDTESPVMLIAAAQLVASVTVDAQAGEKIASEASTERMTLSGQQGAAPSQPEKEQAPPAAAPDAMALLDEAKEMAAGDEQMLAVIEQARAQITSARERAVTLNRVGGPGFVSEVVDARSRRVYVESFVGGARAEVGVRGDGDTDLDLFIYDENGNLIAQDIGSSDRAYVSWTPRWTGRFRIVVENLGYVWNRYTLVTN